MSYKCMIFRKNVEENSQMFDNINNVKNNLASLLGRNL